ncbi:site-specific DNA-methyltransferase [Pseudomonas sp. MG-9]|uniref:site-specific DNA-methyltransferase n=1 Tax=Pseudomonas sp. MG-9 TaxID=2839032 RepID=UPI001C006088|nr:site-specific DNA-methyltransferase [Pseudomonas sp. MG-9]MBT9266836.1 site-specific DNA-methyltransferase [Pseudomonas sp. MG-9]
MDKLKMHSKNLTEANIDKLAILFPNCITEALDAKGELQKTIDFDLLRQELSASVVEGPQERYQLNWPGKREALLAANAPIAKTLRPCRDGSVDFNKTKNLFIEGDNLEVLKLLQEAYLNQVKLIYIDPPYNTGTDLIYEDDFSESIDVYLEKSNQVDVHGNRMVANPEANGKYHSKWLSMMYPRLRLAKNLLDYDGVICVSISDIELKNTISVLNEVFGELNYVNTISVMAKVSAGASGGGEDKRLKKNVEYIVIYAKSLDDFNTLAHLYTERPLIDVINEMRAEGESWKYTSILLGADERIFFGTIKDGDGNPIDIYKRAGVRRTTISKACKQEGISEADAYKKYFKQIFSDTNAQTSIRTRVMDAVGRLEDSEILEVEYVPRSGRDRGVKVVHTYISNTVRRVIWLHDVADASGDQIIKKEKLGTLWDNFDYNNVGKEGDIPFPDGKKPIDLIRTCIDLYNGREGIFMDFFAGSCSLPHAVMKANSLDSGSRRFIAIQIDDAIDKSNKKYESAIKFYEENNIPLKITEIGKERMRRAGSRLKVDIVGTEDANQLDTGFRVLKIDTSNMKEVYYTPDAVSQDLLSGQVDNIREDRTAEDLLFQVLLDWGVDLALPINQQVIAGKTVFFVDGSALVACFDTSIGEDFVKQLAEYKPLRVVFRDAGFVSDSVKINVEQMFKLLSPATEIKTL